jgi:uracil-DNA glycosylase family 4
MDDLLNEIERYFIGYMNLYGKTLFLDHDYVDTDIQDVEEDTITSEANSQLDSFHNQIKTCRKCALGSLRTNFVFGSGNPDADLMFVGEAPGHEEDLQGKPFVGRAGQLLTLMLQAINLSRDEVFIANVLKCRPPNNRDPLPEEVEKCEPYLLKQIDLISPKLIVTLGRYAAASLLRTKSALGELRKELHNYNNVPLVVTYHPAALLRNPLLKREAWIDLKKITEYLQRV